MSEYVKDHYQIKIGTENTLREFNPDYPGSGNPYLNIECCKSCAKAIRLQINGMKGRTYPSGYCPACNQELPGDAND